MLVSKAARRYATALLELAKEQDVVERTFEDVQFIKNTFEDSRELQLFMKSPVIKPDKKVNALEALFEGEVSELVYRFITLIARKNRQNILGEITTAFINIYNQHAGIIEAEVFVAREMDDEQTSDVISRLEEVTGKKVNITVKVQEDLKGGMAIKIDDTVIDGTIKHKLEQLEDVFLNTAME